MKTIKLNNGNIAIIKAERIANNKVFLMFEIISQYGYWNEKYTENYSVNYYNSSEEYIKSNY
jgi:hypothetical protein